MCFSSAFGAGLSKARARAQPPPPPRWGHAPGSIVGRSAYSVEAKAVVRIEVAVSPHPCLGCGVELHGQA
jgi:hypothetical protein